MVLPSNGRTRRRVQGLSLLIVFLGALSLAEGAPAGQQGGSIYYEDPAAAEQALVFRLYVWDHRGNYSRYRIGYRAREERRWRPLDTGWGWTPAAARREAITSARDFARDGYLWRFALYGSPPARAKLVQFGKRCFADGVQACVRATR